MLMFDTRGSIEVIFKPQDCSNGLLYAVQLASYCAFSQVVLLLYLMHFCAYAFTAEAVGIV
jgi:hypothetical protein